MEDERIIMRLDKLVDGMEKIVAAIPRPASFGRRVIEILITVATVAGILSAVDIIVNWLGG